MPFATYIRSCFTGTESVKLRLNAIKSGQSMLSSPVTPCPRMREAKSIAAAQRAGAAERPEVDHRYAPSGSAHSHGGHHRRGPRAHDHEVIDLPHVLAAAGALRLNGGTLHGAKGTKHAAVAGIGLEHRAAALAFIEELARVRRHGLGACEAAFRAREHGFKHRFAHCLFALSRVRLRRYTA